MARALCPRAESAPRAVIAPLPPEETALGFFCKIKLISSNGPLAASWANPLMPRALGFLQSMPSSDSVVSVWDMAWLSFELWRLAAKCAGPSPLALAASTETPRGILLMGARQAFSRGMGAATQGQADDGRLDPEARSRAALAAGRSPEEPCDP